MKYLAIIALACTVGAASAQPFTTYDTKGNRVGGSSGGRTGTINRFGKVERYVTSRDGQSTTFIKQDGSRYTLTTRRISNDTVEIYRRGRLISRVKKNGDVYDPRGNLVATKR